MTAGGADRETPENVQVREALARLWERFDKLTEQQKNTVCLMIVQAIEDLIDAKIDERLGQR